jgi:hypothetical protein
MYVLPSIEESMRVTVASLLLYNALSSIQQ